MLTAIIIPFRDRGVDPLRKLNLHTVMAYWQNNRRTNWAAIIVSHDGRTGTEQFNRSAAYNRGVAAMARADVFIFAESDMIINQRQIDEAVAMAAESPGLIVPFNEYRYLSPEDSQLVRNGQDPATLTPESVIPNEQRSAPRTGPINVMSRATIDAVGRWDENFEGNWWDDRAMHHAFATAVAPIRMVDGPAYHLYHLPGHTGSHLTPEDRAATECNRLRYLRYRTATTPQQIRELTQEGSYGNVSEPHRIGLAIGSSSQETRR
jgi:hypothetical protein